MGQLTLDGGEVGEPETIPQPVELPCMHCGEPVLVVELANGRNVMIDAEEVMPFGECPLCRQVINRGHQPGGWCYLCSGTQVVGEALPQPGVTVSIFGHGSRVYDGRREPGESVHRIHACALQSVAS